MFRPLGAGSVDDRNDRQAWAEQRARLEAGLGPLTAAPVVAQAKRSARQVQLRHFPHGCEIPTFDASQSPRRRGAPARIVPSFGSGHESI